MNCTQCEHSYLENNVLICLLSQRPVTTPCADFIRHHGDKDGE